MPAINTRNIWTN